MLDRRRFLGCAGAAATFAAWPRIAFAAAGTDRRFVFVIQRGAADGLDTLVPYADPNYAKLRGAIAVDPAAALKLDGMFALNPALKQTAAMYKAGQALFVHAVASPYRERSHFDGQNVLETGGAQPYAVKDGWMNRLSALLPKSAEEPIAFAPTVPMALRGAAGVTSYAPSNLPAAPDDLLARVDTLYAGDPQLHGLWSAAMAARDLAGENGPRQDPASLGKLAATFLVQPTGPRIAMIETGGWDTHTQQAGRLGRQLGNIDILLGALRDGMGPEWAKTTVLVATEFGRTAAVNGTGGTDHGTAAAAMLVGGAVKGGRVIADWPGLAPGALYESRDLKPTTALDALIAGAAGEALGIEPVLVGRTLFREAANRAPMTGLVRV